MHEWSLAAGDPLSLTIAADARLGLIDYTNDHIWELAIGSGEPLALSIQTNFGLRARSMRIFPLFTQANTTRTDPASFYQPPKITQFFPNYLCLVYSPFSGVDVTTEYWVPNSQVLACRSRISNSSVIPIQILLEWAVMLAPLGEGQGMSYALDQKTTILQGQTSGLEPVFCMSGAPTGRSGPFPTLSDYLDLSPGNVHPITWALASLADHQSSLNLASQILARPWETEIARVEMFNTNQIVDIKTGDPDWDAVFAFSQKTALGLLMGPGEGLPHLSFVLSRQPDYGYSRRGDGADFGRLWDGQSPIDAYFLSSLVLPGGAHMMQNIVRNFLSTQAKDGQVDGKPGLAGQRSHFMAAPLLAALAWKAFQCSQDEVFLTEVFPGLIQYLESWFQPAHDRDADGFPEWDHPVQSGFEENPVFDRWHSNGMAYDISTFEAPGLASFLFNEIQCLGHIAKQLNQAGAVHALHARSGALRKAVESTWDPSRVIYHYRDRDTHLTNKGGLLAHSTGPGEILLNRDYKKPRRLLIHLSTQAGLPLPVMIHIQGATPSGLCVEELSAKSFLWVSNQASLSTLNAFTVIGKVLIEGISPDDQVSIYAIDYSQEDITLLLPLWAQITHPRRSENLVKKTILNPDRFFLPFGLAACPPGSESAESEASGASTQNSEEEFCSQIHIVWNQLIAEGLLNYGFRAEAVNLFSRLMPALISSLKMRQGFYHSYHAQTGEASGERNILDGLAPVGLFLDILGVQIISPDSVIITGINPFSWPVTVKYRGLTVIRQDKQTQVLFPDGQTANISGTGKHWVSLTGDNH